MKPAKDMKQTLRYKLMVKNLQSRPAHVKEAALLKEIVGGKQWRMDAVLEAIDANLKDWNHINRINVFQQAAMFGRLTTFERMSKTLGFDEVGNVCSREILTALNVAIIHGHYKVADYCHSLGARSNHEVIHSAGGMFYAVFLAIRTANLQMLDRVLKYGYTTENIKDVISQMYEKVDKKVVNFIKERTDAEKKAAAKKSASTPQPKP